MEEEKKVEETKEVKPTYKKHGPLYWIIIVVGMTFIVFMSVRMGEKIATEKFEKGGSGKKTTVTSNSNSNEQKTENKMSEEEALKLGNEMYSKGDESFFEGVTPSKCISEDKIKNGSDELLNCTEAYNYIKGIYSSDNKVARFEPTNLENIFASYKEENGKYYHISMGAGGYYGTVETTLAVKEITENKITYTATTVKKPSTGQVDANGNIIVDESKKETNAYDFVIVKEDNAWKISYFIFMK